MNFNTQKAASHVLILFIQKNYLIYSCVSFQDFSAHKISWSQFNWCKLYIHHRSLNVRYFGTVATTVLQVMA